MYVENTTERDSVLDTVWLTKEEREQLVKWVVICDMHLLTYSRRHKCRSPMPLTMPWSSGFYLCCQDVRRVQLCQKPR